MVARLYSAVPRRIVCLHTAYSRLNSSPLSHTSSMAAERTDSNSPTPKLGNIAASVPKSKKTGMRYMNKIDTRIVIIVYEIWKVWKTNLMYITPMHL